MADLRSSSRDAARFANHKAKWAHGVAAHPRGRAPTHHPRPFRPADMGPHRFAKDHFGRVPGSSHKAAAARRADMLSGAADDGDDDWNAAAAAAAGRLSSSPGTSSASEAEDEEREAVRLVAEYEAANAAADAACDDQGRAPGAGGLVLLGALDRAVEAFEDRETVRLVRDEWAVVGEGGEVQTTPLDRKRRARTLGEEDEDEDEWVGGEAFEMI